MLRGVTCLDLEMLLDHDGSSKEFGKAKYADFENVEQEWLQRAVKCADDYNLQRSEQAKYYGLKNRRVETFFCGQIKTPLSGGSYQIHVR